MGGCEGYDDAGGLDRGFNLVVLVGMGDGGWG